MVNAGDEQSPKVNAMFDALGVDTSNCLLPRFAHTTLGFYDLRKPTGWRDFLRWILNYPLATRRLTHFIAAVRPDIVHFNSVTLAPYARVSHALGIPTVVHVREPVLTGMFGCRMQFLRSHLNRYADRVIAICRDNLERVDLPPGKAVTIYNPVDFSQFDYRADGSAARERLAIHPGAKVALFAGGSVPVVKGLHEFLQAMDIVKRGVPDLVCLMPFFDLPPDPSQRQWTVRRRLASLMGVYRKSDELYRLVTRNSLDNCIIRTGFVHNIEQWIAAADVVCVPHIKPHFSRTVMEAGAMKKPVVAFKIGGVEEVVQQGVTGLMVPCGDVHGLAEAVARLMRDTPLAVELGEGGYAQAVSQFDAAGHAAMVAAVYDGLVKHES